MSDRTSIAIFTIGTQGDIRPCIALGLGLERAGHAVRIVTSDNFASLVQTNGLPFYPLTSNFQSLLEMNRSIADRGMDMLAMARIFRDCFAQWARHWVEEGIAASEGTDLLIGVGNSTLLARSLAEARGLQFVGAQLQPLTPSRVLAPMVLVGAKRRLPELMNLGAYQIIALLVWYVMSPAINGIVRPALGLRRYPWYGPYFNRVGPGSRVVYGFSPQVLPRPSDWPDSAGISGYWFLDEPHWQLPDGLRDFLEDGPKPVYIGFGSMVNNEAKNFTTTLLDGLRKSKQRAVLATGWGGLDETDGVHDEQIFYLRQAPHDRLFPLMSIAVHHGGAGTVAAAARAGIPSIIVPFYGDQPFWARCLNRVGAAPPALDRKTLTADQFANALATASQPTMIEAAARLGRAIRSEDGVGEAMRHLRAWRLLPVNAPDAAHAVPAPSAESA